MKLSFEGKHTLPHRHLMRRAGYAEHVTRQGKVSYVRRLRGAEYPRFHAYIDINGAGFSVNLHLDQKAPTYGKHTAHSGEYTGELVENEASRLGLLINTYKSVP